MAVGRWIESEIEYLKQHYPIMKTKDVAIVLKRSYSSIESKALKIGLHKKRKIRTIIECGCGCGAILTSLDDVGRERKFLRGHSNRKKRRIIECECGCGVMLKTPSKQGVERRFLPHHYKPSGAKHTIINGIEGKVCAKCEKWYPLIEYHNRHCSQDGKESRCNNCCNKKSKAYGKRSEAKAKRRKRERRRRQEDKQYRIKQNLRRRIRIAMYKVHTKKSTFTLDLLGCTLTQFKQHLQSLFQPGMTWDNYGRIDGIRCWELDHIRPCASFDLTKTKQQKECFHFSNIQPLWHDENLEKSDSWEEWKKPLD